MTQGKSTKVSAPKVEPKARAVSPSAVVNIGVHQVRTHEINLYEGRGYQSPTPVGVTNHGTGPQGKHRRKG